MATVNQALVGAGAPPTLIEYSSMKFLITYMPDKTRQRKYIEALLAFNTRRILNVTEQTYSKDPFAIAGIAVEEIYIPEGTFPNQEAIDQWLHLVRIHFATCPGTTFAVHDQSGLGRSAVLVAIALTELGMTPLEAINIVRGKRPGAFNTVQYEELVKYQPKNRLIETEESKLYYGRYGSKRNSDPEPSPGTSSGQ